MHQLMNDSVQVELLLIHTPLVGGESHDHTGRRIGQ